VSCFSVDSDHERYITVSFTQFVLKFSDKLERMQGYDSVVVITYFLFNKSNISLVYVNSQSNYNLLIIVLRDIDRMCSGYYAMEKIYFINQNFKAKSKHTFSISQRIDEHILINIFEVFFFIRIAII
jgi:hypothetical protein